MSNIIINAKNHTIEMNKTVSKAASRFGTPEYNELQEVRRAYPTYHVVTVAKKAAKPAAKKAAKKAGASAPKRKK